MAVIIIPIIAMAAIIGLSNFAVQYQINDWLTWGAFTYPVAFLVTDLTNRVAGPVKARLVVCAGFAVGVVLSLLLADMRIAIASGTAFLIAQLLDVAVFDLLRSGQWWKAPLVSTLLASAVDTALFFSLAFAATGLPWMTWALGVFAAQLLLALLLLGPFGLMRRWLPSLTFERGLRA